MSFFGLFNNGPYMAWAKRLPVKLPSQSWRDATYQVVASPAGLPMVQLDLQFQRWDSSGKPVSAMRQMFQTNPVFNDWYPSVANPDMSLAILMDRSGSMGGTYRDGHVYNVCATILNYV